MTPGSPCWRRLLQPSVVRRLVVAQVVLLLQLWGALLLWMSSAGSQADSSAGILRGHLVIVPIAISVMLLVIPAWLAVHVALRPWRRVNEEIAARGPGNLAPLTFEPRQQELRPLVRSVNDLLGRVREGAQRERQFIADAAHELRTPLAAMRVNVEALQNRATDARSSELLEGMVQSGDRAARLVGQLLQLMRTDALDAATPWQPVALDHLVNECLATLSTVARPRGVELQVDVAQPVQVWGDAQSLASMIDNLVENAIKYSPAQAEVVVKLESRVDRAVLTVTDQGAGIAPALHSRVFDRFYRGPDQTEPGSGLGLAIVKAAVQRHHGTVALETAGSGRGLRVVVNLPRAVDGPAPAILPPPTEPLSP
jgi:signal transduction histidine kinase